MLEPWVGSNWYPDPANPGMARYYNGHTRAWIGKPKKDQRTWAIPTEPPEQWVAATDPSKAAIASVRDCRVLGGHGLGLAKGAVVEIVFWRSALTIRTPASVQLGKTSPQHAEVPYEDVVALEIGGPGAKQTGGGFVGGGFGLEGAAEGMLIASALNLLTTRTKVTTVICLQTPSAELFLQHTTETPDALRIRLSQVFNILRQRVPAANDSKPSGDEHVVDRLAKLADMLDRGLLNREEFDRLKSELL